MIKHVWDFIQNEMLRMKWLSNIFENLLRSTGLNLDEKWVKGLHFFLYDVFKIVILLCILIFLTSYIQSFFSPQRSKKILVRYRGIKANTIAALLGTITPFCSCSSIPLFIGFSSAGLPVGVTFSFLISSPMVDLGSLFLLMSIFGTKIAIIYVFLGLLIAITAGIIIEKLNMQDQVEEYISSAKKINTEESKLSIKDRITYSKHQMLSTLKKVFPYIIIGVGIGALIHNWIPETWIIKLLGKNNPFGVILSVIAGVPMYADIFGTIPIAEALFYKNAQLGTILAFMMSVTTLSLPSMIMLRKAVKPKLLTLFIIICTFGIILVGYAFNFIDKIFL